jgi:hypothetical protein
VFETEGSSHSRLKLQKLISAKKKRGEILEEMEKVRERQSKDLTLKIKK